MRLQEKQKTKMCRHWLLKFVGIKCVGIGYLNIRLKVDLDTALTPTNSLLRIDEDIAYMGVKQKVCLKSWFCPYR